MSSNATTSDPRNVHAVIADTWTNNRKAYAKYIWDEKDNKHRPSTQRHALGHLDVLAALAGHTNPIAVYTTDPQTGTCKWCAFDIDNHRSEPVLVEKRREEIGEIVNRLDKRLRELGAHPIIERSAPDGSCHVWVLFSKRASAERVFGFATGLVAETKLEDVETFPKQAKLTGKLLGNSVRLPGPHHTAPDYVSELYVPTLREWLPFTDERAQQYFADPPRTPLDVLDKVIPPPGPQPRIGTAVTPISNASRANPVTRARAYLSTFDIVGEGGRDQHIVAAARALAQFGIDAAQATDILIQFEQTHCSPPQDHRDEDYYLDKAERAIDWARGAGVIGIKLDATPSRVEGQPNGSAGIGPTSPRPASPARTELGHADRLIRKHGDDLLYCGERGKWLVWEGDRWVWDERLRVQGWAQEIARNLKKEAVTLDDDKDAKKLFRYALASQRASKVAAAVSLARPYRVIEIGQLDADPWLLNCRNGTLDLRTGSLRRHDRADHITKLSPVDFDPNATCPRFLGFLNRIYADDPDLIECVRRWFGYCQTGDVSEQRLPILWGDGANGKNTLSDTISGVMGDYALEAPPKLLVGFNSEHATVEAGLMGARLVIASETEEHDRLRLERVKRHTGNPTITARFMRGDYFQYERTHKLLLHTNHKPALGDDTEATWRRLLLIPHAVVIPESERDPALLDKLAEERAGILNWLVAGCLAWQRDGLLIPEAVEAATASYRQEQDAVAEWIDDCCTLAANEMTPFGRLWDSYQEWEDVAKLPKRQRLSRKAFANALDRKGLEAQRRREGRFRVGILLIGGDA